MAKLFQITLPDGMSELNLDSQGRATAQYAIVNKSARSIDARAVLVALPQSNPPDPNHPVNKGWIKIAGSTDQHMDADKSCTYTVNIAVPLKTPAGKNAAGTYSFRLDVVSVAKTDEGDSSRPLKFTVASVAPPQPKWGLIALIALVVVCVVGLLIWLLSGSKPKTTKTGNSGGDTTTTQKAAPSPVPAGLVGMNLHDASVALGKANLSVGVLQGDGNIVMSTNPVAGVTASDGKVDLTTQSSTACTAATPCVFKGVQANARIRALAGPVRYRPQ